MAKEIAIIDVGTSKISAQREDGQSQVLACYSRRFADDPAKVAFIPESEFRQMLETVIKYTEGADVLGVTGFGHSVVPIIVNDKVRAACVGDDPSLSPASLVEMGLDKHYPNLEPTSGVRKLAGLLERPELYRVLFDEGEVNMEHLFFSSTLSFLAASWLGIDEYPLFPTEADDFVNHGSNIKGEEVASLFGLRDDQLRVKDSYNEIRGTREAWALQDFKAEAYAINGLFEEGLISSDTCVVGTDSVLKRVFWEADKGRKKLDGLWYDTMRMMGNTGTKRVLPIMTKMGIISSESEMFDRFDQTLQGSTMPTSWLFNPRAGEEGELWHKVGDSWKLVTKEQIPKIEDIDLVEAIKACGWGMSAGMYMGIDERISKVAIYGGLMCLFGQTQPGWKHVFTAMAPKRYELEWLKMPDSRKAMELFIRSKKGEQIRYGEEIHLEKIGRGGGKLTQWLDIKNEIDLHGRMSE